MNNEHEDIFDSEPESLGAFQSYIRRPTPRPDGLVSQFYGENGDNADTITALSLTKFQEQRVHVSVWLLKDPIGRVMKESQGYPLVASFMASIRRPTPKTSGMVAQLYAKNGKDADAVNQMGLSKYQDALVFVELHEQAPAVIHKWKDLDVKFKPKKSAVRGSFAAHAKIIKMSGFLRSKTLHERLGGEEAYKTWLDGKPCCAATDPACQHAGRPTPLPERSNIRSFAYVPMCDSHARQLYDSPDSVGGLRLIEARQIALVQEWAWDELSRQVSGGEAVGDADPQAIIDWATRHGVDSLLPAQYFNKS